MVAGLRSKLTYANVMATIAVLLALGGGSFAYAALKKNTVKSKQIAPDAVKEQEIAPGAVGTEELADAGVTTSKLADAAVTAQKIADGSVSGAKLGTLVERTATSPLPDGTNGAATAKCEPGERVISGGARVLSANVDVNIQASTPATEGGNLVGWTAFGSNQPGGAPATSVVASVICAQ
jgi:hypothetical protein